MGFYLLLLVLVLIQAFSVSGFANYMTGESCDLPLEVGEYMMGRKAVLSSDCTIRVYRNDEEVPNGSFYNVGDKLRVNLEPAPVGLQLVLEVRGGFRFYGGKCDGRVRTNTYGAIINVTPEEFESTQEMSIVGAWALSYSEGVKIAAEPFVLYKNPEESTIENKSDL